MAGHRRRRAECFSKSRVTAHLLLSFLSLSPLCPAYSHSSTKIGQLDTAPQFPIIPHQIPPSHPVASKREHAFTLRQIFHHGTHLYPNLHRRHDVPAGASLWLASDDGSEREEISHLHAWSDSIDIQRLSDRRLSTIEAHLSAARSKGEASVLSPSSWTLDQVEGPNVTDKQTVLSFSIMAANAYDEKIGEGEWEDVGGPWNYSQSFGWESDGLRGHIFADKGNETIVIAMKGTTPSVFDGSETTTNDKVNDNLFFSCCCAQGGQYFWRQVCDCYSTTYTCNQTCVVRALKRENRYYRAAMELYTNVTALYPDSNVWLTGHSLGGATCSLLGMTFGLPTVTFEAPGQALAATRLGLPAPPESDPRAPQTRDYTGAYHFGHTADPIFMGTCNGATSACTLGGYAMETACHTGQACIYDTVEDKGWRVAVGTHSIRAVIRDIIKIYDTVPKCERQSECRDCFNWNFFESNGSDTSTSSSSSSTKTKTRTTTCKTPGWWGCLDETTTTTTSSSSTTSTSTSTCKTPGWFGCNDQTTTTSTTPTAAPAPSMTKTVRRTSTIPMSTTTASCSHLGWFGGCNDPTSMFSKTSSPSSIATHHCETPGLFWGCRDVPASTKTTGHTITSTPSMPEASPSSIAPEQSCTSPAWLGLVCLDPSPTTSVTEPTPTPSDRAPLKHCRRRSWLGWCKEWDQGGELKDEI